MENGKRRLFDRIDFAEMDVNGITGRNKDLQFFPLKALKLNFKLRLVLEVILNFLEMFYNPATWKYYLLNHNLDPIAMK